MAGVILQQTLDCFGDTRCMKHCPTWDLIQVCLHVYQLNQTNNVNFTAQESFDEYWMFDFFDIRLTDPLKDTFLLNQSVVGQ